MIDESHKTKGKCYTFGPDFVTHCQSTDAENYVRTVLFNAANTNKRLSRVILVVCQQAANMTAKAAKYQKDF